MIHTKVIPRFSRLCLAYNRNNIRPYSHVNLTAPNGLTFQQPTGLFIGGDFVKAASGKKITAIDPATESSIVDVEEAGEQDTELAITAAEKAHEEWSGMEPWQRGRVISEIADVIEENMDLLATIETWNNGKTYSGSKFDVGASAAAFRHYAGYADKIMGSVIETDKNHFNFVTREPIGVCGLIVPWNFPFLMLAWKLAPCLACGNALVLKTAESTPLSALVFADLIKDIPGLPKGTVNIISGYGSVGQILATHPKVKKVAFTGSTQTGRKVLEASSKSNLKKVTLELGGKSPNIVFDDCPWEHTLETVIFGIYFSQGEVCAAGSRLLLHESIYDKFLDDLKTKVEKMTVGDPWDPQSWYGAQTNEAQFKKVLKYIETGKEEGARLVTGGCALEGKGFYIQPTIFSDVDNSHTIAREEIFGPVLSVIKFKDADEAIKIANDSSYGLASGIHTNDLNRALYVSSKLKAGSVFVNGYNEMHHQMPFGGYAQSGIGRESGKEVLNNYLEIKSVRVNGVLSNLRK